MTLCEYLKTKDRAEFAKKVGVSKGYVDNLCSDSRYIPSRKLAHLIEEETRGQVSRLELLYPKLQYNESNQHKNDSQ